MIEGTASLSRLDTALFHLVNGGWTNPLLDGVMPALSMAGKAGAIWLVLLGAIALFGREPGRRIALAGFVALVIGFVSSGLLKELTMRPRPFLALEHVRLLLSAPHSYAFPSGHATTSFAVASGVVLASKRLLEKVPGWSWGMLILAAAISYSRVYVGVHWPTDVVAGAMLGLFSGWSGMRLSLRRRKKPSKKTIRSEQARELEYAS